MYYYRHGEVIFASLLPDLPLEPAKRPSAGTPASSSSTGTRFAAGPLSASQTPGSSLRRRRM